VGPSQSHLQRLHLSLVLLHDDALVGRLPGGGLAQRQVRLPRHHGRHQQRQHLRVRLCVCITPILRPHCQPIVVVNASRPA
jgi:hypothetical protein